MNRSKKAIQKPVLPMKAYKYRPTKNCILQSHRMITELDSSLQVKEEEFITVKQSTWDWVDHQLSLYKQHEKQAVLKPRKQINRTSILPPFCMIGTRSGIKCNNDHIPKKFFAQQKYKMANTVDLEFQLLQAIQNQDQQKVNTLLKVVQQIQGNIVVILPDQQNNSIQLQQSNQQMTQIPYQNQMNYSNSQGPQVNLVQNDQQMHQVPNQPMNAQPSQLFLQRYNQIQ